MEITKEQLKKDQEKFASNQQRAADGNELRIKLIENAIIVKAGPSGWFSFSEWEGKDGASEHIGARLEALKLKRKEGA